MKKIKIIFSLLSPIADIIGILAFFGLSASSIWVSVTSISKWFLIVSILSSLIVIRVIVERYKKFLDLYENYKVKINLEKGISETNINQIDKILPSNDTLKILLKKITERALLWADDATLRSINLYIDYKGTWQIPSLQVYFFSKWKNEMGVFYEGSNNSESYEEPEIIPKKIENKNHELVPFFILNKNWQTEVVKVFNSVSTRVGLSFTIRIHQDNSYIITGSNLMGVNYKEGRVEKHKSFKLDSNFSMLD